MSDRRYIVLTLDDAKAVASAFAGSPAFASSEPLRRIHARLQREEGADMEDLVQQIAELGVCGACSIEGQEAYCAVLCAQKQGRRLRRLLERAREER